MKDRAIILMYHGITSEPQFAGAADVGTERYVVSPGEFVWQMGWLSEAGCGSLALQEFLAPGLVRSPAHGSCSVGLTFDDGRESDYRIALPILQRFRLHATFFVVTDWIGRAGFLSRGEIRELARAGMAIGSHGTTHRFLRDLSEEAVRDELTRSRALLEGLIGCEVSFLSLPGGQGSATVFRIAQEVGYRAVCTSLVGTNRPGAGVFSLRRVPVTGSTSRGQYRGLVRMTPWALGGVWMRYETRRLFRRAIGERAYLGLRECILSVRFRTGVQ